MTAQQFRVTVDANGDMAGWVRRALVQHLPISPDRIRVEPIESTTADPGRVPEASCFRLADHGPHEWGQYQGDKYTKRCRGLGTEREQNGADR